MSIKSQVLTGTATMTVIKRHKIDNIITASQKRNKSGFLFYSKKCQCVNTFILIGRNETVGSLVLSTVSRFSDRSFLCLVFVLPWK